jgi:hypothetical protein
MEHFELEVERKVEEEEYVTQILLTYFTFYCGKYTQTKEEYCLKNAQRTDKNWLLLRTPHYRFDCWRNSGIKMNVHELRVDNSPPEASCHIKPTKTQVTIVGRRESERRVLRSWLKDFKY